MNGKGRTPSSASFSLVNKTGPRTQLLLALLVFSLLYSSDFPAPARAQTLAPHDPILITRDSNFNATNGVVGGSGTQGDPYIIEGWDINATTGLDQGSIYIRNTRAYFTIRNVYIHPTSLVRETSGIRLDNVQNGIVENARITNNTYGIWLANSNHNTVKYNTVWNNTNGIYVIAGTDNTVSNNQAVDNTQYGIWVSSASLSTFRGNNATGSAAGFIVGGAHDNLFEDNYSSNNIDNPTIPTGYGFRITTSHNNLFRNNTVFKNPFGMIFEVSTGNLAIGNNSTLNLYGMGLEGRNKNNTFTANRVTSNQFGIYIFNSSQNLVYNNLLQNFGNAYDDTTLNSWNTTKSLGTNILGGPFLGGNFYSDYQGTDLDGDGIGETPHNITGRYPIPNKDWLPLSPNQPGGLVDVRVASVTASPSVVNLGEVVSITVTVVNEGTSPQSFTLTAYANNTQIASSQVTNLLPQETRLVSLSWSTQGLVPAGYSLSASVPPLQGEMDTGDNSRAGNAIRINAPPTVQFTFSPLMPNAGQQVAFDASQSLDSDGSLVDYSWNFGDGQTGTGTQVSHAFLSLGTYTVTLTVTDGDGGTNSLSSQVRLNTQPRADFTFPQTATAGTPVAFDASSSSDPDPTGTITLYVWDFGDGEMATTATASVSHVYPLADSYIVSLTVFDENDASASTTKPVSVQARPPGPPADLVVSYSNGKVVLTWSAPSENGGAPIAGYEIWRGVTQADLGSQPFKTVANVTLFEDEQVSGGQIYYYSVRAINNQGMVGNPSDQETFKVPLPEGSGSPDRPDNSAIWTLVIALTLILAGSVLVLRRRRHRPGPT